MKYTKSFFMATSALVLICGAPALAAPEAQAQTSVPASSAQSTASDPATEGLSSALAEIVVTAQRRSENLQRTAASVSVKSGDELLASGKFALSAILEGVPGVSGGAAASPGGMPGSSAGTDSPAAGLTIRGIPSNASVAGSATSVSTSAAIYVDGVYNGVGGTYDIDRVEILRGPQGTLYGRSATTGVVVMHTRKPNLEDQEGNLTVERGNYDLEHYTGAVNIPIVEGKAALRLSGNYYARGGYDTHDRDKGEDGYKGGALSSTDYRAKLLLEPADDISVLLGFAGQDNKVYSSGTTITQTTPDSVDKTYSVVGPGKNKYRQYWAELNWSLGDLALTYLPAYRTWRSDAVTYGRVPAINLSIDQTISTPKDHFLTHELRLASQNSDKLSWQVGALYYQNDLHSIVSARDGVSGALDYSSDTAKKTTAAGVFGEATYAFTDTTRLNVGLRYDYTKVEVNQVYTTNTNTSGVSGTNTYRLPENLVTRTLSGSEGTRKFNNVTYKVRLEHDLSPRNLVYALTSSGFSPGDVGVATGADGKPVLIEFDAETLTSYEVGSKNRFLDNRLQVNASAFYYVYGAYQVANIDVNDSPLITAYSTLSAPARAYGGEMEILFQPSRNDRIGLNLSYTKAYFIERSEQTVPGSTHTFDYYFSRKEMPNVVPFQAQLSYDHDFPIADGSRLILHSDVRFQSAYYSASVTQDEAALGAGPYARTGSQFVGNLNATWVQSDDRFSVSAYVRNVGNNRYKVNAGIEKLSDTQLNTTTDLYEPRTYGIVLSAKF